MSDASSFWDVERGREDRYDFARLQLSDSTTSAVELAFRTLTGAYRATSRRQCWRHLVRFSRFVHQDPRGERVVLADPNVLLRYRAHLVEDQLLRKTSGSHFNFARRLLEWLVHNVQDGPWRSALLFRGHSTLQREAHNVRDNNEVSAELLRRIASICKREIDQVIEHFSVRERLERGEEVSSELVDAKTLRALRELIALEKQGIYTQRDLGRAHRGRLSHIGLRHVERYRALSIRSALPYYLLVIISTCGNPVGIKDLDLDCLEAHPTDPRKRRIFWDKHRAGRQQAYDVSAEGRYSVSRCVSDLVRLTAPIRGLAMEADRKKLFISRTGGRAKRICVQSLHNVLATFRAEHSLPYFTFVDLRRSAAVAVDQFTKSARAVKRVLQHQRSRTSRAYLQAHRSVDRRYEGVLRFQGKMIDLAIAPGSTRSTPQHDTYETASGLRCRDPLVGLAAGSTQGERCLQWLQCCTCPNAIIIRDDPTIVARILRAAQSLRELGTRAATSTDLTQHFETVFRPTLHVIESQILPRIATEVRAKADVIARTLPDLPLLE